MIAMIDPSDLDPVDLDDEALPKLVDGYLSNGAGMDDWVAGSTSCPAGVFCEGYALR